MKQLLAQVLSSRKVWRVSLVSAFVTGCALGLWMLGGTTLLLLVIFSGAGLALSSVSPRLMEGESAPQSNTRRAGSALPSHLRPRKSLRRTIEVP